MTTTPTPPPANPYAVELALAAALAEISAAQDAQITQAWAQAWSAVSAELLDTLTVVLTDAGKLNAAAVVRYDRLAKVLGSLADHLDEAAQALGVTITSNLHDVVTMAETGTRELIAAQRLLKDKPAPPIRRVPSPAMTAIVRRTTEQVTSQLQPLADETYTVVLRELTKGVAAGDNPRETASRMLARSEDHVNFGRSRALTIARTEMLDAYREGAQTTQDQYPDVLAGWAWIAHLGPRTCRSCLAMHGRIFDADVAGPHDHQQGRCSRMPVVREEDGSVDTSWLPDAEEHFRSLDEADQRAILGKAGYDAWRRGAFPISQWAKVQENPGWRESIVPAKPGDHFLDASTAGGSAPGGSASGSGGATPPGTPPARAGEPRSIAESFNIVDSEMADPAQAAATAIDQVHLVPAEMPGIDVKVMPQFLQDAKPDLIGSYGNVPALGNPHLFLRPPVDTVERQYTAIHELGHALDDLVFGTGEGHLANGTRTDLAGEFAPWWDAVQQSQAYKTLGDMAAWDVTTQGPWVTYTLPNGQEFHWTANDGDLEYLMRPSELFARAYTQWIIQQAGTPAQNLAVDLDRAKVPLRWKVFPEDRTPNYPLQWSPDDFAAIAEQLRLLFEGRGLIPGGTQ